jgi:hypothetical protein
MKGLTVIIFLVIMLLSSYSHAQMDRHMMNNMMGMTQDMAIMMRQMSVIMENIDEPGSSMSQERMGKMSMLMKDMSAEMDRISGLMQKGEASQDEMRDMQLSMIKLQERMWELKK